jgi:predicted dehydrogenase
MVCFPIYQAAVIPVKPNELYMQSFNHSKVRWGVIGAGDVCEVKSAPAMNLVKNSELAGVMRRNSFKAQDFARRHNVPKWYDDVDELLNDPGVNAIYIATPPGSHAELTRKAAAAGKPVYVEKPMARTYQECLDMIDLCEQAKVPLFVAYYRRYLPNYQKVKELVQNGAIGDVRTFTIQLYKPIKFETDTDLENNWRVNPDIAGDGYFYDLASHQLDFLDFLLGPAEDARGFSVNQGGLYPASDNIAASFRFNNGVTGTGNWCFTTGRSSTRDITTIIGSKGEISFPTFSGSYVEMESDEYGKQRFDFQLPKHIQYPLIESIVNDLLGLGRCISTGVSAARTNLIMEKATLN